MASQSESEEECGSSSHGEYEALRDGDSGSAQQECATELPLSFLRGVSTGEALYSGRVSRASAVEYGAGMEALRAHSPMATRQLHLLACRECEPLAAQMLATRLGKKYMCAGNIKWGTFPDGYPNTFISRIDELRNADVVFLADFLNPANLFEQFSLLYVLPRYSCRSVTVVLPYFPTGTMERVEHEGQVATAMTLARMMGGMPLGQRGPAKLMIYDIHALQVRFYFSDTVLPVLLTAIPLLKRVLCKRYVDPQREIVITFPDDGACKRFARYFDGYELVICAKVRDGDKRVVRVKDGEVSGRATLIVDDLVQTGGTLIECKNALVAAGATSVGCFVTHAVFPNQSWKRFTPEAGQDFDTFYVTDSCTDTVKQLRGRKPFEVISLANDIVRRLLQHTI